jgi:hypothetical protein
MRLLLIGGATVESGESIYNKQPVRLRAQPDGVVPVIEVRGMEAASDVEPL